MNLSLLVKWTVFNKCGLQNVLIRPYPQLQAKTLEILTFWDPKLKINIFWYYCWYIIVRTYLCIKKKNNQQNEMYCTRSRVDLEHPVYRTMRDWNWILQNALSFLRKFDSNRLRTKCFIVQSRHYTIYLTNGRVSRIHRKRGVF